MRIARMFALFTLLAPVAAAQTIEQLGYFRLQDDTPRSARAAALGGVADPLGADFTLNPATAASIRHPMLLVQGQRQSNAITVSSIDAQNATHISSYWMDRNQLTFVAGAAPAGPFVMAAYYASDPRLVGPEATANTTATAPYSPAACPATCQVQLPLLNLVFDREQKRYGVSASWERGTVAIGAGLEMQQLRESSEINRTLIPLSATLPLVERQEQLFRRIDDRALVPNAGIRWRATPRIALAAAYNGGGTFRRTTSACTVEEFQWDDCTTAVTEIGQSELAMPDAYRAAIAWDVNARIRTVGEVVRRNYSSLAGDGYSVKSESYTFPYRDVTELHAGVEYQLASLPLVLRAGWWSDPSRLDGRLTVLGKSLQHYTAGAGIRLGDSARLDVAYDRSDDPVSRNLVVGVTLD